MPLIAPTDVFVFRIGYSNGSSKQVKVYDWSLAGAWATIWRDLGKNDHGNTNEVMWVKTVASGKVEYPDGASRVESDSIRD